MRQITNKFKYRQIENKSGTQFNVGNIRFVNKIVSILLYFTLKCMKLYLRTLDRQFGEGPSVRKLQMEASRGFQRSQLTA